MTTPASWSLRRDKTFFTQAQRKTGKSFLAYFQPHSQFEAAIIVPKTVLPLATDRNRLKRQVKAILVELENPPTLKLALVAKHPVKNLTYSELKTEVASFLSSL